MVLLKLISMKKIMNFKHPMRKYSQGGDMVRGSDLVVTAVWEGREFMEKYYWFFKCSQIIDF